MKTKHKPQHRRTRRMPSASNPVAAALARDRMRAQMRDFSIAIFMTPDGEEARELLAHLGWLLAMGAEVLAQTEPHSLAAKRAHGDLRTVLQMAESGARWQAVHAGVMADAAQRAKDATIKHADLALHLAPDADWIAARIRDGVAKVTDVAGAEVYRTTEAAP